MAETGTTGTVTARYLRGINLIAREKVDTNSDANSNTFYYLFNAHGDAIQHINLSGEIKSYKYDVFGNEQSPDKLDSNPFRYCGEYFDRETGEIYLRARYYNPAIGRFGAEDSARSGLNWYTYCGNNPVARIDPTGHYDREASAAYAMQYEKEGMYNPNYMPMDKWGFAIQYLINYGAFTGLADCTNFVSQALYAGGIEMNDKWHYYARQNKPNMGITARYLPWINVQGIPTNRMYEYDFTSTWSGAASQFKYISNPDNGYADSVFVIQAATKEGDIQAAIKAGVKTGDLIYWDWNINKNDSISHATIISGFDGKGNLLYAAHSSHRQKASVLNVWNKPKYKNATAYIVKMRDDAN